MTIRPTFEGFVLWVRTQMVVPVAALPDSSPVLLQCYEISLEIVNTVLLQASPLIYQLAVYNLGGDNLVNFAQDVPGSTFFFELRKAYGTYNFAPGVVTSASDTGTSSSLLNPEFMKGLTLANLQNLKSPYGRQYLAWAQAYGDNIWGLT